MDKPVELGAIHCTKTTLYKVVLPPKACFVLAKAFQMKFEGDFQERHAMGGFVILDADGVEIVWAG